MMNDLDLDRDLKRAVYTWLRHCRSFDQVVISMSSDPDARSTREVQITEYQSIQGYPIWMSHEKKREFLADQIADIMKRRAFVAIKANHDGLYVIEDTGDDFGPESEDWCPYIEFIPRRDARGQYAQY